MSWLIVGIQAFQHDRRLDDAGGGRKNRVLYPKRARIILGKLSLSSGSAARRNAWLVARRRACCRMVRSRNRMTLVDLVGLGINGIIGTGIFLLPAKVFRNAGGLSWAAWLAIGAVCLLVGLCFCEASGRADRNGGPYLYARDAFGRWVGVGVGWMALAANVFAYGAVARGFGRNLSFLVPSLTGAAPQIAVAVAVIAALAALNYRGIRPGALTS